MANLNLQRFMPTLKGYGSALQALKRWRQPTITATHASQTRYDYIIVGAGSAGCLLAERLSKESKIRVLLVEAGPKDTNPWIHVPVGYFKTLHNPKYDWCFKTDPTSTGLNGKTLSWPRGKVLGGSSSLNGLLYVRGQEEDYNDWEAQGNTGWGWENVRRAFEKIENHDEDTLNQSSGSSSQNYGRHGHLNVASGRMKSELCERFLEASAEIGLPIHRGADINSNPQEGAGYFLQTAQDGFRCSSAVAHLNQTYGRDNLDVLTDCLVQKVTLDPQHRATGIMLTPTTNCSDGGGRGEPLNVLLNHLDPNSEVILSAGAIGSPQLLQLSGIGVAKKSTEIGIKHFIHLPGVGQNLQDHLQLRQVFECRGLPTLNTQLASYYQQLLVGIQYVANRTGPLSMAASQVCAFVKTREDLSRPDIQFHLQPLSSTNEPGAGLDSYSAFTSSVCQLRPTSVGSVEVVSANVADAPLLCPNYLSTEEDIRCAIDALRFSRKLCAETKAMAPIVGKELRPGNDCVTDDELLDGAMRVAESIYHPSGTCKMGVDAMSVVDDQLKVLGGCQKLRVVDCSIMPTIVSGNTNAPTMMIAQRASEMILSQRIGAV
jgi:choline dehydrogenase